MFLRIIRSDQPSEPIASIVFGVIIGCWLILGTTLALSISQNRAFQVDEVEHLHASYHVASDRSLYNEIWQPHNPLLYWLVGSVTDPSDPVTSYRRGRAMMLACLFITISMTIMI